MKQVEKLKKLENLSIFTANSISQVTNLEGEGLYENISRWISKEILLQLKKGLYTTTNYYQNLEKKEPFLELLSNKLKYPSYLSLEYILSKHQILSENVYTYTSVTKKTPKVYNNKLGRFSYKSISEKLFLGFEIVEKDGFNIAQAKKPKALFDYLYLKFYRREISEKNIEELRLNLDEFSKKEIQEFEKYCDILNIAKFKKLPNLLFKKQ